MEQFIHWFSDAQNSNIMEPNAFVLSTAQNNQPHSRTVLVKEIEEDGFVFYTNYLSEKAKHIETNNQVAANFTWLDLERQIRFFGTCVRVPKDQSDIYFEKRPRSSQIGAWASKQSQSLDHRKQLEKQWAYYTEKFKNKEIPRPSFWGGYKIIPTMVEFWQGRPSRMHDRILYKYENSKWTISRVSP